MAESPKKPKRIIANAVGCVLFDEKGKLLKRYLSWACAYFPNGKLLLADGFTLTLYDANHEIEWVRDQRCHHNVFYSAADNTALITTTNILPDRATIIDRLEVYDGEGRLVKEFDFTPAMSFHKNVWKDGEFWDDYVLPKAKQELSHVVSFHRVNKNSSRHPALAEGNYVVSDVFGRIYFFDRDLKKIVHEIRTAEALRRHATFDVQVSQRGNLLLYNTKNVLLGEELSSLEEIDPFTGKLVWSYGKKPGQQFDGAYEGNLTELPNGNFLFSHVNDFFKGPLYAVEVTRQGREVWRMTPSGNDLSGYPNVIRRLDLTDYYRSRGGRF